MRVNSANAYELAKQKTKSEKNHEFTRKSRLGSEIEEVARESKQYRTDLEEMQSPFKVKSEWIISKYQDEIYSRDKKEEKVEKKEEKV